MPTTLSEATVTTAGNGTISYTALKAEVVAALSNNTPQRWTDAQFEAAFKQALRECAPLGKMARFSGVIGTDGAWVIGAQVLRVLRLRLAASGIQQEIPIGAIQVTATGPVETELRVPFASPVSGTCEVQVLAQVQYDTGVPSTTIQFPWPELLRNYWLANLYEQRVDLTTLADEEGYAAGMTVWRQRADIRKTEILMSLGLIAGPVEEKKSGGRRR